MQLINLGRHQLFITEVCIHVTKNKKREKIENNTLLFLHRAT